MIQPEKWCPFHEPAAALSEMVRRGFMPPRADGSVRRPFHGKSHGCLIGELQIEPSELPEYRQGIFASAQVFPAVARFSSAFLHDDRDPDVRGLAIKVSGVSGEFCDGAEPGVQDFLMVSHPAAPFPDAGAALELLSELEGKDTSKPGNVFGRRYAFRSWNPMRFRWRYLKLVLEVARTGLCGTDLAGLGFHSSTPYKLGEGAVKYELRPETVVRTVKRSRHVTFRNRLRESLESGSIAYGFYLRPKLSDRESLEEADLPWTTPCLRVGRLVFPPQDFSGNDAMGERLAFSPWNCLRDHEPLGSINAVRRSVYREAAELRGGSSAAPDLG
ncbi:MAG: hypothetical protein B9S36_00925 [Verrucomicrobiia bacterium Tous-C2TDCM]|nr:MAG: hypothetical protein B9S36_00925 [Verrucomicrobiae bacterium Tous-C2TDCM]